MSRINFVGITAASDVDYNDFAPLAFGYLSSYLKKHMPNINFFLAENAKNALSFSPHIIGISATSVNYTKAVNLAKEINEISDVPVIIGGVHISMAPFSLSPEFALGVIGEGEVTLLELMSLFEKKRTFYKNDFGRIDGLCFFDNGKIKITTKRKPIKNLDILPHPDRKLVIKSAPRAHLVSSRGCPYNCLFCSSKSFWGDFRTFSRDYVLNEINELVTNFGSREIHFFDDLFVADRERFNEIHKGIIRSGLNRKVHFSLALRAELADEELFDKFVEMGVFQITFGAESASKSVLKYLKGQKAVPESNQRVLDLAHERGIFATPSFIKGSPEETGDDLMKTYSFIIKNIRARKIKYFEIHNLTPFPGTGIWELAKGKGLVDDHMNWEELRYPWEKLYLNEMMPKASFYFFETLTQKANRMLGLFSKKIICVLEKGLDEKENEKRKNLVERGGFFDKIISIEVAGSKVYEKSNKELLELAGKNNGNEFLICFVPKAKGLNLESVTRLVWFAFENDQDITRYGKWRNFYPISDFEKGLFVFKENVLKTLLKTLKNNRLSVDILSTLTSKGHATITYRPDLDPFMEKNETERYFTSRLFSDFKISNNKKKKLNRLKAVENRIINKSDELNKLESENRKPANSYWGRVIIKKENSWLKKMIKLLLPGD